MATVKKEVEVSVETDELAQGIVKIVAACKAALADGFQPGTDLPLVAVAAFAELPKMIGGVTALPGEASESLDSFLMAWLLAGKDVYKLLKA